MIKEIFEIEPKQKNSFIIFLAILPLTFLQLYLFKTELIDKGTFVIVSLCLALTVCWYIVSIVPIYFFFNATSSKKEKDEVKLETVLMICGLFTLAWIILLTYIAYELNYSFKDFIRGSLFVIFLRCLFWFLFGLIFNRNEVS